MVAGVDNGLGGGLAATDGEQLETYAMPTTQDGKHRVVDPQRVVWLLEQWKPELLCLEYAHAMPRQGVTSTFSTARGYGTLIGIAAALGLPLRLVRARTWQGEMLAGAPGSDTKARSVAAAQRQWPSHDFRRTPRCRDPHDGLTDAALIALWGWRHRGER